MKAYEKRCAVLFCLLAMLVPVSLWGSTTATGNNGRMEPPPEAFAACSQKSEGAVVQITTPRGDVMTATCRMFNGRLAARPDKMGPPPGGGMQPPSESTK